MKSDTGAALRTPRDLAAGGEPWASARSHRLMMGDEEPILAAPAGCFLVHVRSGDCQVEMSPVVQWRRYEEFAEPIPAHPVGGGCSPHDLWQRTGLLRPDGSATVLQCPRPFESLEAFVRWVRRRDENSTGPSTR